MINLNFTQEQYGDSYKEHILEIYKLYVDMADRVSQRRANTNAFFISVNTFLVAMVTLFGSNWPVFILTAATGIF